MENIPLPRQKKKNLKMEISAEQVRELREKSGAGIMDCKRALRESGGNLDRAIDFLRKAGVVRATKQATRTAEEGLIGEFHSPDGGCVALVEINCETDFVARTDQFQHFVQRVSEVIVREMPRNAPALLDKKMGAGTVGEGLQALAAQLGENIVIRRFALLQGGVKETIGSYLHAGSKIGVLIKIRGEKIEETTCRDLSMHIAAMNPLYLERSSVPPTALEKEKEILAAAPELIGKPPALLSKIVEGKLARYYSEVCLLEQPFIKDPGGKKTVGAYLKEKDPAAQVVEMVRFQVGTYA